MEKILRKSLKLNFTPNTLGCYELIVGVHAGVQPRRLHLPEGRRRQGAVHREARQPVGGERRRVGGAGAPGAGQRVRGGERAGDRRQQHGQPAHGHGALARLLRRLLPVQERPVGHPGRLPRGAPVTAGARLPPAAQGRPARRGGVPAIAAAQRDAHGARAPAGRGRREPRGAPAEGRGRAGRPALEAQAAGLQGRARRQVRNKSARCQTVALIKAPSSIS